MGTMPKISPKPLPPKIGRRIKAASPYLEPYFITPDWLTYKKELYLWRKQCESIPIPRVILPCFSDYPRTVKKSDKVDGSDGEKFESYHDENIDKDNDNEPENKTFNATSQKAEKLSKSEEKSKQQNEFNVFSKGEKKNHNNIGRKNKLSVGQRESKKQSGRNSAFKENKENHKIEERNKSSADKGKYGQRQRSDFTSQQENKIHDEIDMKTKLSSEHRKSGKQSRKNTISTQNKKIHKVQKRDKLSEDNKKSDRSFKMSFHPHRPDEVRREIDHDDLKNNECNNYTKRECFDKKMYLDGKETHLILTGVTENDITDLPISQATSGIACVTPYNSDESFFQALNLNERKKSYPRGRENLSRNWQEWFHNIDEEFIKIEKEANKIIKSVEGTLKLMGPEVTCDSCCSCRQTRKANMLYHKTKTAQFVIDSVAMDGERNKYIVGSLAMNSPAPSPSESIEDLPEVIQSHDNIIKNNIISGVTNEKGEMNYYVTGVSKEIVHVPRKIIRNSGPGKPKKNVPPCGCAIEKMINENLIEIMSDDNIPWIKGDQTCIGKKYRPRETGASSCRDYPNDRTCRRNPFKKKIDEQINAKLREREKSEKDNYPPEKKNMYSLAAFQPCGDEDGMAICGGPWGAVNIPDEEELARREAEAKLIRESPPCGDKPGRAICGAPFGSRHPIPKKPKKDDEDDDEEETEDEEDEEKKKRIREPRRKRVEAKIEKALNRDENCSAVAGKNGQIGKLKESSIGPASKIKQYRMAKGARGDRKNKFSKDNDKDQKDERKSESSIKSQTQTFEEINLIDARKKSTEKSKEEKKQQNKEIWRKAEIKMLKNQWNRQKIMASKFIDPSISIPQDPPKKCTREDEADFCETKEVQDDEESPKEGPFGRRTISEQALPTEKTLIHLVEPNEPIPTIPVRPGGKPCKCRENRNAKKILLYNVTGITRDEKSNRKENLSRVIDGLIYITPIPSARNSEEYIPEYELYESPYEKCKREQKDDNFKYIERYLGPKSLMKKQPRDSAGCKCSITEKIVDTSKYRVEENENNIEQKEEKPKQSTGKDLIKPEQKKWSKACRDEGLIEFYARCRDNVPCWLRCVEFKKDGCCMNPRKLQVMRPVCECKYEKKIVKREEEKKKWLSRQERLKSYKKEPYAQIGGLSRPMQTETNLIISDVKRIYKQDKSLEDEVLFCVAGIKEDRVMAAGECILSGIGMHTPTRTPEPSKPNLPIAKLHRHWSPMDVQKPIDISDNLEPSELRQSIETKWKQEIRNRADKRVDVLFKDGQETGDGTRVRKFDHSVDQDRSSGKDIYRDREKYKRRSKGKDHSYHRKTVDDTRNGKGKDDTYRSKGKDHSPHRVVEDDTNRGNRKDNTYHSKGKDHSPRRVVEDDTNRNRKDDTYRKRKDNSHYEIAKNDTHHGKGKDDTYHSKEKDSEDRDKEKDSELKNIHSVHYAQQPLTYKSIEANHKESGKDSPETDFEEGNQNNVHKTESAENITPQEKQAVSHSTKIEASAKLDLNRLMQIELEKMANEGFLFAKLPACHQMPQLQYWIMYRKGIAFSPEEKKNLMGNSMKIWESSAKEHPTKMKAPSLDITKEVMKNLNWDEADKIKREMASKRTLFYSNLRKSRVLRSRAMWGLMEFGKFPGVSFKRAYFTYHASKESDGFVFRPWSNMNNSEES